jgi:hypothetical protein
MSAYSTGTISIVAGATTATGAGTAWLSVGIAPGLSVLTVTGSDEYAIVANVQNNTALQLAAPWPGITFSNTAYAISIDFTPNLGLPLIDETSVDVPALWNAAMAKIDAALP